MRLAFQLLFLAAMVCSATRVRVLGERNVMRQHVTPIFRQKHLLLLDRNFRRNLEYSCGWVEEGDAVSRGVNNTRAEKLRDRFAARLILRKL